MVRLGRLREGPVLRDAREVELALAVLAAAEVGVVGRDERQAEILRGAREDAVQHPLLDEPVVLQLDVEAPRIEAGCEALEPGARLALALLEHPLRDHAAQAAGEPDQPGPAPRDHVERDAGGERAGGLDVAHRDDVDEVPVALLRGGEQDEVVDRVLAVPLRLAFGDASPGDVHLAAEDRLHALLLARLVELDRAEHVAVVGEGHGAHAERLRAADEVLELQRAVQQRVLRVDVQVDELGCHGDDGGGWERASGESARDGEPPGARPSPHHGRRDLHTVGTRAT